MLNCDGGLKADENWMSTETSWVRDVSRDQRDRPMADDQWCKALKVKVASLNRIRHSIGSQWSRLRISFEDSGDVRYCWYRTTRAAARWIR